MTKVVALSDFIRNPSKALVHNTPAIVLKNNKPSFVAVPYHPDIEDDIADLLEMRALAANTTLMAEIDTAAADEHKYTPKEVYAQLGL